jgi:hypothetical protein
MARAWPILILALAACARTQPAGFDAVGPGYAVGGGTWNTGGGITAAARVLEREGRTVVCGAWTTDRQSVLSLPYNSDVMQAASVYLGGERLVQNLGFMAYVPETDSLAGVQARCVASSVSWRPEFAQMAPGLRFPRMAFPQDGGDDEVGGSGDTTVFRQTPRPDILR